MDLLNGNVSAHRSRAEVIMLLTPCNILFRISSSLSALCSKLYALFKKLFCFLANRIACIYFAVSSRAIIL